MTKHIQTCGNGRGGPRAGSGRPGTGKEASFDDIRKKLNIPKKPTYNEDDGLCFCVSHCFCDNCPEEKHKNAELACADIVTRYVSATNVVMSMEHSEEELMVLIDKCVNVSDTLKDRLQVEWETEHMAHDMPLLGCASCGIRDPQNTKYRRRELPLCFKWSRDGCLLSI
jgi:hypothetical protein